MKSRGGKIINIGSIAGDSPECFPSPYTTSKHAIRGLTEITASMVGNMEFRSLLKIRNTMVERGQMVDQTGR